MTAQDKNIAIAKMLGWKYVTWMDRKDEKYGKTINEGWYSVIPNIYNRKINGQLYKGRNHNDLKFHSDANWQFEAKKWIVETNFNISPQIHRMYFNIFACQKTVTFGSTYKVRIHSDFKDVNIKVDSDDEKEAIFEALYQFSQYLKQK